MQRNGVIIEDTFAEAFRMRGCRVTVTAINDYWALTAAQMVTGFAVSVIGCDVEAGIEGPSPHTPDGRPGYDCLFFANSADDLAESVLNRVGQAILTCVSTACYCGALPELPVNADDISTFDIGDKLRYFGDGYQSSKVIGNKRYWRVPVMDGEFLVQESFTMVKAVGGGNLLFVGPSLHSTLTAAEAAVAAIRNLRGVIMPFPGGIVRSGSQVGSRYKFMNASTNVRYCPTIRRRVEDSALSEGDNAVLEIVMDGLNEDLVGESMRIGIRAACDCGGISRISAGNYGGKLGKFHFHLHQLMGGGD
jgi:formylmethanofuran--tetrahydromethanopterin N-formyltransferase